MTYDMWDLKRNDTNNSLEMETDSQNESLCLPVGKDGRQGQLGNWGLTCTHGYIYNG